MKALEILKRLLLLPWAFIRPSRLPRCPRCKVRMDAHNNHETYQCRKRCETCAHVVYVYAGPEFTWYCNQHNHFAACCEWCKDWAPKKGKQ